MAIRTELVLRLPNSPGALSSVCRLLADAHVHVAALHLDSSGRLHVLTNNPLHAAGTLREAHHAVEERDVLYAVLPNRSDAVAGVTRLLAEAGVNIDYAYGGAGEGSRIAALVVGVADVQHAATAAGL